MRHTHSLSGRCILALCVSPCLLVGIDSIIEPLDVVLGCLLFDDDLAVALAIDRLIERRLTRMLVIVIVIDR